jgi:hypothetical protein
MRLGLRQTVRSLYDPDTDALVDGYVAWREASAEVHSAYDRWSACEFRDWYLGLAGYIAALDREQHAACVYEQLVRAVAPGCRDPAGLAPGLA